MAVLDLLVNMQADLNWSLASSMKLFLLETIFIAC